MDTLVILIVPLGLLLVGLSLLWSNRNLKHGRIDIAYAHGIQVGQQMMMSKLMPTEGQRAKALAECVQLVKDGDAWGFGLTLTSLNDYRGEGSHVGDQAVQP